MVSDDQAKENIYNFLIAINRDGGFSLERIAQLLGLAEEDENPNVGTMLTFESPFGDFSVSKSTGDIVMYSAKEPEEMGSPRITEAEADEIVMRFVRDVYPSFDKRDFKLIEKEISNGYFEYSFKEKKGTGEISIFPNYISISVRPDSGMITHYSCSNLVFRRTTKPKISEVEARRIVEREIAAWNGTISELELVENPVGDATKAITVWLATITYQTGKSKYTDIILINADTGEKVIED